MGRTVALYLQPIHGWLIVMVHELPIFSRRPKYTHNFPKAIVQLSSLMTLPNRPLRRMRNPALHLALFAWMMLRFLVDRFRQQTTDKTLRFILARKLRMHSLKDDQSAIHWCLVWCQSSDWLSDATISTRRGCHAGCQ